jgi:hypothetical protein
MTTDTAVRSPHGTGFQVLGFLAVAVLTAASWWGLLGWDTEKTLVPGSSSDYEGPYEVWQLAVLVLLLLAIAVGAILLGVRPAPTAIALTLSLTANFFITGLTDPDGDGLFAVGALFVFLGTAAASTLVVLVTYQLRKLR